MTTEFGEPAPLPRWTVSRRMAGKSGVQIVRDQLTAEEADRLARRLGVEAVLSFRLSVAVAPYGGDGLSVVGEVEASVVQTCVVTLEPMENLVREPIDLRFRPPGALAPARIVADDEGPAIDADEDVEEPLVGDAVDLGPIAAEFLVLGVDPYPRKPGAALELPSNEEPLPAFRVLKDRDAP